MKFLNINKGEYNYINRRRIYEIIKTIVLFSFAIGLYLLGYITLKTNKSLWSVFAVLSVLPAAKSAVSMIMFIRFSSISKAEYDEISKTAGIVNTIYELVFTTRDRAFYVHSLSCADNTIIAYFDDKKEKNAAKALKELKEHIDATLKRDGITGYSIKLYTKLEDYTLRLAEMNEKLKADDSYKPVFNTVKAVII